MGELFKNPQVQMPQPGQGAQFDPNAQQPGGTWLPILAGLAGAFSSPMTPTSPLTPIGGALGGFVNARQAQLQEQQAANAPVYQYMIQQQQATLDRQRRSSSLRTFGDTLPDDDPRKQKAYTAADLIDAQSEGFARSMIPQPPREMLPEQLHKLETGAAKDEAQTGLARAGATLANVRASTPGITDPVGLAGAKRAAALTEEGIARKNEGDALMLQASQVRATNPALADQLEFRARQLQAGAPAVNAQLTPADIGAREAARGQAGAASAGTKKSAQLLAIEEARKRQGAAMMEQVEILKQRQTAGGAADMDEIRRLTSEAQQLLAGVEPHAGPLTSQDIARRETAKMRAHVEEQSANDQATAARMVDEASKLPKSDPHRMQLEYGAALYRAGARELARSAAAKQEDPKLAADRRKAQRLRVQGEIAKLRKSKSGLTPERMAQLRIGHLSKAYANDLRNRPVEDRLMKQPPTMDEWLGSPAGKAHLDFLDSEMTGSRDAAPASTPTPGTVTLPSGAILGMTPIP